MAVRPPAAVPPLVDGFIEAATAVGTTEELNVEPETVAIMLVDIMQDT